MEPFTLDNIPQLITQRKVCVVGVIGKNSLTADPKSSILNSQLKEANCNIQCEWNEKECTLYMYLSSCLDTKNLLQYMSLPPNKTFAAVEGIDEARTCGDYLVAVGDFTTDVCKDILLIFHLCHLIILYSPGASFDISYVNVFKAVDTIRLELQPKLTDLLSNIVSTEWASHGRFCCPRVLFYFESCPRQMRNADLSRIKKLEHSIEDQIYHILRKSRVITNVCAKSLFAIPKNEEFVYMNTTPLENKPNVANALRNLVLMCQGQLTLSEWSPDQMQETETKLSFKEFLQTHVDIAFNGGFDDNVGKYAANAQFFELPPAEDWRNAATCLFNYFHSEGNESIWESMWNLVSIDTTFSKTRCAKVLPIAQAAYSEGLPTHYSTEHHLQRVAIAVNVFEAMARGPLADYKRRTLEESCENIWKTRRLCEVLSLTGNPCVKPQHSSDGEEDSHTSGIRYPSSCNCGRTKLQRDDPYTLKQANYTFYVEADCAHCPTLTAIQVPVFLPSDESFREAQVTENEKPQCWLVEENCDDSSQNSGNSLSSGNLYFEPITDTEKSIAQQPSTTEYLPGILHLESPIGLLPAFPSWSLVCIGASSLYSHSVGLPEHLQPGLLPHTNSLLPWDCAVKSELSSQWRRRGPLTVKIFLGLEYECVRGHRFMLSSTDESASTIVSSDTPLYCHCVCRGSKTLLAQLMKIHIVTPKAPVHVTIDPKVQPVPGGPIFIPGWEKPAKLSSSAYWILRLPYIYGSEKGILPRPSVPVTSQVRGRLLGNCVGLAD